MTQNYIDILKVWTVNTGVIIFNESLNTIEAFGDVIQSLLTIVLLMLSIIYTIYKTINEKDRGHDVQDDR